MDRVSDMGIEFNFKGAGDSKKVSVESPFDSQMRSPLKDPASQPSKELAPGEPGMIVWKDFESRPLTHNKLPFEIRK
jgi:hypothetical protein